MLPEVTEADAHQFLAELDKKWENWGDVNWEDHGGYFVTYESPVQVRIIEYVPLGEYDRGLDGLASVTESYLPIEAVAELANNQRFLSFTGHENEQDRSKRIFTAINSFVPYYGHDHVLFTGPEEEAKAYVPKEFL